MRCELLIGWPLRLGSNGKKVNVTSNGQGVGCVFGRFETRVHIKTKHYNDIIPSE